MVLSSATFGRQAEPSTLILDPDIDKEAPERDETDVDRLQLGPDDLDQAAEHLGELASV